MPSQNTNIIANLRGKHDPHYKLATRVDALEKDIRGISSIHVTLSKSFGMQRKTLMRVLALEKQVAELRQEKQQGVGDWGDEFGEWDTSSRAVGERESFAGGGESTGGTSTATATKDPGYASRVMGQDAAGGYLSSDARKAAFKRTRITGASFKRGSSVGGAQKAAASTAGTSALAIRNPSASRGVTPTDADAEKGGALAKGTESLIGPLKSIDSSVDSLIKTLKQSNKADAKEQANARKRAEKATREQKEGKLEGIKGKLATAAQTVLKPVQNIFEKIWNFLKTVFLGRVVLKLFEWFTNPANGEKVASLFRFLKDWWPVLVAGIMAVVGPGMIFTAGLIALLVWGVPKIIEAVKWVGSLFGIGVDKELKNIDKESAQTGDNLEKTIDKDLTKDTEGVLENNQQEVPETGTTPAEVGETQKAAQDVQAGADQAGTLPVKMAGGGQVPGSGNRDTVPAMLTPGEFVMSKGAVQQYGSSTLAGMNAAAGGTNRPTRGGYQGGGVVQNVSANRGGMSFGGPKINYGNGPKINYGSGPRIHYSGGGMVGRVSNSFGGRTTVNVPQKIIPRQPLHFAGGGSVPSESSSAEIVRSSPSQIVINPPVGASPSVNVVDPVQNANTEINAQGAPSQELPEFSASKMRSVSKIKTLGIVV